MITHPTHSEALAIFADPAESMVPPEWLRSWVSPRSTVRKVSPPLANLECLVQSGTHATLVSVRAHGARIADHERFRERVESAYTLARATLAESPHPFPVRVWNFIPGIHDLMDSGATRYMAFNEGRFAALSDWLGRDEGIVARAPAASGVGQTGADLFIYTLAASTPGQSVENPVQVPSYRYSARWGRVPPCFARATRMSEPESALFISGTAAVTGEESTHEGDFDGQWNATLHNIEQVLIRGNPGSDARPDQVVRHTRIYVSQSHHLPLARERAMRSFPNCPRAEILQADLCRPELLVEIEAVACVPCDAGRPSR